MNCVKAVIFDAYGTLFSTGNGSLKAAQAILSRNGREDISPTEFYGRWKALHREHIDKLTAFENEESIFKADLRCLYEEYALAGDPGQDVRLMLDTLGKRQAFPETAEVWDALSRRYLLAIGSTTDTAPLQADMTRAGLVVSHVYTSESLGVYKPRPMFYEKILQCLNVSASEALFVGDSLIDDVSGPGQVGMKTCWVNRKGQKANGAGRLPDYQVTDLTGLLDILL